VARADLTVARGRDLKAAGIVATVSAIAAAIVFRRLGSKPLWLDEAVSISVAGRTLPRLLAVLPHRDANAGLYYLVLHYWLWFGHSTAWDRGLSAICFVAAAGLATWVGVRWRGVWAGAAAGLLIVTNRFLVFYGQEARPYSAAVLLGIASTTALFWDEDGGVAFGPYVVLTILLLYTDLFAALFVGAQAVAVVAMRRGRDLRPLVHCWLVIGAVTAPLWLWMITAERGQIAWLGRPDLPNLERTIKEMGNGAVGLTIVCALSVVACVWAAQAGRSRDRSLVAALTVAFIAPPIALWLFAQVVPSFDDRYVICSAVAAIGLAALGFDVVRRRSSVLAIVLLVVVCGLGGSAVLRLERAPFKYENTPALVALLRSQAQPSDAIGFGSGGLRTVVDMYMPSPSFEDVALAPGSPSSQPDVYLREVDPSILASRLSAVERLWLITDPNDHLYPSSGPFAPLRGAFDQEFQRAATTAFPGMDLTLYLRRR
jgi:uncharacterized membrane protein